MRLSAVTNLALVFSVALIACSNTDGTPGQTSSSGSPDTSNEETSPTKGGSTGKTSAKTSSGSSKNTAASNAKGGKSSTSAVDEPAEGGSGGDTSATKSSNSSKASNGGSGGTSGSKSGSASGSKGGAGGSSSGASSATGGTGARTTTGATTARGGTSATTTSATTQNQVTITPVQNGQDGWTTRYWDCCKPSCGWKANTGGKSPVKACGKDGNSVLGFDDKNACEGGGTAFQCNWGAPWAVADNLAYGYAAHNGVPCGTCVKLQFTGSGHSGVNAGAQQLSGKQMIVQVINIGGIEGGQFDLLIPGGGVGAMNGCTSNGHQWSGDNLNVGQQYGGIFSSCSGGDTNCALQQCQQLFGTAMPALMDGCKWYANWFKAADNPNVKYEQTPCPAELTSKSGMN